MWRRCGRKTAHRYDTVDYVDAPALPGGYAPANVWARRYCGMYEEWFSPTTRHIDPRQ